MTGKEPEQNSFSGDRPPTPDTKVAIGTSFYTLSEEAQKYLKQDVISDYESLKSILIIQEPHQSVEGQFSLYKGLEVFFRDNPTLVDQTIFLAEGHPASQQISVQSLIDADSNPNEDTIRETLSTFLITGYMAYEWKYQQGIPIVGTENDYFYDLSRVLIVKISEGKTFYTIENEDGRATDIPYDIPWGFSVVARNKSIAQALIEHSRKYENPTLFVGGLHLEKQDSSEFDFSKFVGTWPWQVSPFGQWARYHVLDDVENLGLYDYLKKEKIGFTLLNPFGVEQDSGDDTTYTTLFKMQRQAEEQGKDYKEYLQWFLKRDSNEGVTVRPSPEAAAEFVRKLKEKKLAEQKSGVVYEAGQGHGDTPNWFQVSRDEIQAKLGKDTIWDEPPVTRGRSYEQLRAVNLGGNYKIVDDIHVYEKVATSMKTINTTDSTYWENPSAIESVGKGYVDKFEDFSGVTYPDGFHIAREEFEHFHLEIAVPYGKLSAGQLDALHRVQEYGREKDILVIIAEVV